MSLKATFGAVLLGMALAVPAIEYTGTISGGDILEPTPFTLTIEDPVIVEPTVEPPIVTLPDLGANEWVDLGTPKPDPTYGLGRGRSWTPKMINTPKGLCLIGAGGHGSVNLSGHYQDDVTCYKPDTHSWVMLDPGTKVSTLLLELDENGFEVDPVTGNNDFVAQMGHGYNLCTYTSITGEIFCLSNTDPSWPSVIPQRFDWLPEGSTQYSGTAPYSAPWRLNVETRVWTRDNPTVPTTWDREESVVEAVGDRILHLRHGEVWWYNLEARTWTKSSTPTWQVNSGYDSLACYMSNKLYVGKGTNFSVFDTINETWSVLPLDTNMTMQTGNGANLTCDTTNNILLLNVYVPRGTTSFRAFDVATNQWGPELNRPAFETNLYKPVINAVYKDGIHWYYANSDSEPRDPFNPYPRQEGRIFAYRYAAPEVPVSSWEEKCSTAIRCTRFVDQASVDAVYVDNNHTGTTKAEWDPTINGGKLTIEPFTTHDTAGMFWYTWPPITENLWIQYRVRMSSSFVDNPDPSGSKVGILYYQASCSGQAIAHMASIQHGTGKLYPNYYESCGAHGYKVNNPLGNNFSEWDSQPGGDTACHRHTPHPTKPCFYFSGDEWVTFTTHVDLINRVSRGWAQVDGQERIQIMEFPTQSITIANVMQLGPYMNGRDNTINYPLQYFWFNDFIVSENSLLL